MWLSDIAEVTGAPIENVYDIVSRFRIPTFKIQGRRGRYIDPRLYLNVLKEKHYLLAAQRLERALREGSYSVDDLATG